VGLLWTCEQLTLHLPCSILRWIQHQMIPKCITRPASKPLLYFAAQVQREGGDAGAGAR